MKKNHFCIQEKILLIEIFLYNNKKSFLSLLKAFQSFSGSQHNVKFKRFLKMVHIFLQ